MLRVLNPDERLFSIIQFRACLLQFNTVVFIQHYNERVHLTPSKSNFIDINSLINIKSSFNTTVHGNLAL